MAAREDEERGALLQFAVLVDNAVNEATDDDSVDIGKTVALALAGWSGERVMAAYSSDREPQPDREGRLQPFYELRDDGARSPRRSRSR